MAYVGDAHRDRFLDEQWDEVEDEVEDVMQSAEQAPIAGTGDTEHNEDTHACPLCGDAGWPDGTECRKVREARAEGRL